MQITLNNPAAVSGGCGYQPRHFAYAKFTDENTVNVLHGSTGCKDYMTDALVAIDEERTPHQMYFPFRGPIETEHTVIAFRCARAFLENFPLFQQWELSIGITPTEVFTTQLEDVVVLKADKWWMTTTVHLSLFLSWLRNLSWDKVSKLGELCGDQYIFFNTEKCLRLGTALTKLTGVTIKRNAPDYVGMHSLNGHYTVLMLHAVRKGLTYGPALAEIDPDLFPQPETRDANAA